MKQGVWRDIGIAFIITWAILSLLYPEQLVFAKRRFMMSHDTEIHLDNLFLIVAHFFQGNVQLFNRFDLVGNIYNLMTAGLYSIVDILLAGIYIIISPFSHHSGETLHRVYSYGYTFLTVLLRILGGYLFLAKFTKNRAALIIALVYLNVFLASQFYNRGMHVNNLYSYLPLLFYFILNFFERFNAKDFCLALLVFTVAIVNSPFFALSYFYVVVHFFIIACAIVHWRSFTKTSWALKKPQAWQMARVGIIVFLLLLPYALMYPYFKSDFFIANSGLNGTQGRLGDLSIASYFSVEGRSYAIVSDFLLKIFDFTKTQWGHTWMFFGFSTVVFMVCGAILSRQKLKFTLILLSLFILSLNVPAEQGNVLAIAHWINVLTNPFHFLDRSFHMVDLLWYFTLSGFIVLGIDAVFAIISKQYTRIYQERMPIVAGIFIGLLGLYIFQGPADMRTYVFFQTACLSIFFYLVLFRPHWNRVLYASLIGMVMISVDVYALHHCVDENLDVHVHLRPKLYEGLMNPLPQIIDYQNPKVFPQRVYYKVSPKEIAPPMQSYQHAFGAFYSHAPITQRYLQEPYLYSPRPMVFKDLSSDQINAGYLLKDGRNIFFAPYGMDKNLISMENLLANNLDRQIVLLDKGARHLTPETATIKPQPLTKVNIQTFTLDINTAHAYKHGQGIEYQMPLPKNFPSYITTSIFTPDYSLMSLSVGDAKCLPSQGDVSQPFTFDVGNVKEGKIVLLLPSGFEVKGKNITLTLKQMDDIKSVFKNTHDQWGFVYKAPLDGWLVFNYPYDAKWEITIDGKKDKIEKANSYYMAVFLKSGEHKILLQYWPNTPIRVLLLLSALLSVCVLFYVIREGYRRER